VQGLPQGDPEPEDEKDEENADAPADQLLPAASASALVALDGTECGHGT
jgi:hypothetical protein